MLIARFHQKDLVKYGIVDGSNVRGLKYSPFQQTGNFEADGTSYKLDEVKLLTPCVPSKIIAIGLNYKLHVAEADPNRQAPKSPIIFLKPPSCLIANGENIVLRTDGKTDHEAELCVVIGKTAKDVPLAEAKGYVFGYTCVNDVSERIMQRGDGQWVRAKGFDTFGPMGPWIATEIDGDKLKIECLVNGETKQSSNTSELIFGVAYLVSFISHVMTLFPGDVIATGTPNGVSQINDGDIVDVRIENIGTLRNPVVKRKYAGETA